MKILQIVSPKSYRIERVKNEVSQLGMANVMEVSLSTYRSYESGLTFPRLDSAIHATKFIMQRNLERDVLETSTEKDSDFSHFPHL